MTPGSDAEVWLRLHLVPGLGPKLTAELLRRFGSPQRILEASPGELATVPRIGELTAGQLAAAFRTVDVSKEWEAISDAGATVLHLNHPDYPAGLREIADPPVMLFQLGERLPADQQALAIVGSRECTAYGRRITEQLTREMVGAGYTIVSGLARGIDACAHKAALAAGGRTLAILAGGLARIYPPEHKDLARQVSEQGALLSETPMKMAPIPEMFPRRNRLISGLSRGVLVVEARAESGALITAKHALEQNKDVFAVPGPIDSAASAGPLRLLRDGAILVRKVEDILEHLGSALAATPIPEVASPPPAHLPPTQFLVWEKLGTTARHMDELLHETGLSVGEAGNALLHLELIGRVRRLPGNRFERRG